MLDEAQVAFTNNDNGIIWLRRILQEEIQHTQRSHVDYLVIVTNAISGNMHPTTSEHDTPATTLLDDPAAVGHRCMDDQT